MQTEYLASKSNPRTEPLDTSKSSSFVPFSKVFLRYRSFEYTKKSEGAPPKVCIKEE